MTFDEAREVIEKALRGYDNGEVSRGKLSETIRETLEELAGTYDEEITFEAEFDLEEMGEDDDPR